MRISVPSLKFSNKFVVLIGLVFFQMLLKVSFYEACVDFSFYEEIV